MTAYPIPNPFSQWNDTTGLPLTSGYIYIGEPNQDPQTHPIAVYQDAGLSIPYAQPLRTTGGFLVGAGTPVNAFPSSTPYSISVRNKANVEVYYRAEVHDELAEYIAQLTGPNAADLIGWKQTGTGAVQRNVGAKLRDFVSVEDFGAVGNGTTNDYAAFNAAVTSGAKKVFALGSNYKLNSTLVIPAGVELIGAGPNGTTWIVGANVVGARVLSYSKLQGFKFTFAGGHTQNGVEAGDLTNFADRAVLQDLFVTGAGHDGIQIRNGNLGTIRDVSSLLSGRDGVNFTAETNDNNAWRIDKLDLRGNVRDGLNFAAGISATDPLASKTHSGDMIAVQNNGRYGVYLGTRSNTLSVYAEANTTKDILLDTYAYGNEITIIEAGTLLDSGQGNLVTTQNADADYHRAFRGQVQFEGGAGNGLLIDNSDGLAGKMSIEKTAARQFDFIVDGTSTDQNIRFKNADGTHKVNVEIDGTLDVQNPITLGPGGQTLTVGTGSPAGVLAAPLGSLYLNASGGAGTTLYVKEAGTNGSSGWVAK